MPNRTPAELFHPGVYVDEERRARKWGLSKLARKANLPVECVKGIVSGEVRVAYDIACGLGAAFGTPYQLWLNLQRCYEAWQEMKIGSKNENL